MPEFCVVFDQAMRTGNVQQMNQTLEEQQWRFIRAGTYLVLEKLKQAVMRRLLKKVAIISAVGGNQLALGWLSILNHLTECRQDNLLLDKKVVH